MKKNIIDRILIILFIVGFLIFIYPIASNYLSRISQIREIDNYLDLIAKIDDKEYQKLIDEATEYNEKIYAGIGYEDIVINDKKYKDILKVGTSTLLGYMEIDSIKMKIPIYHGTSKDSLTAGAGHWENSSFPIGGVNTHAVFFGHRGLPSAELFTDLDSVKKNEVIRVHILNEELYYQITEIYTVKPDELKQYINIEEGKDIITLITCTPYGVNTHRLIIRGTRVDSEEFDIESIDATASKLKPLNVVRLIILPIILISLLIAIITRQKKEKK